MALDRTGKRLLIGGRFEELEKHERQRRRRGSVAHKDIHTQTRRGSEDIVQRVLLTEVEREEWIDRWNGEAQKYWKEFTDGTEGKLNTIPTDTRALRALLPDMIFAHVRDPRDLGIAIVDVADQDSTKNTSTDFVVFLRNQYELNDEIDDSFPDRAALVRSHTIDKRDRALVRMTYEALPASFDGAMRIVRIAEYTDTLESTAFRTRVISRMGQFRDTAASAGLVRPRILLEARFSDYKIRDSVLRAYYDGDRGRRGYPTASTYDYDFPFSLA